MARSLNLRIIGSIGLLVKAKEKGIINSVKEVLEQIEETDFRISHKLKTELLKRAKEK